MSDYDSDTNEFSGSESNLEDKMKQFEIKAEYHRKLAEQYMT